MIRVFVVDNNLRFRKGLVQILSEASYVASMDETDDSEAVLHQVSKHDGSLVILDISEHGPGGFDILKQLKSRHPNLPVMVMSVYAQRQYAALALKLGESGALTKKDLPDNMMKTIRTFSSGGSYMQSIRHKDQYALRN